LRDESSGWQESKVVKDAELLTDANPIQGLFYSKSDEKFTVRALLDDLLGNRTFERGLDVGCGPGHITEPLARRSKQLVLVEQSPQFEEVLRQRFANAKVVISDFREMQLSGKFDAILFSHVLYYQPTNVWADICKSLLDLLAEKGELYVVLNADNGDWWKIMQHFSPNLGKHVSFHYSPLSKFKRELGEIAHVQSYPYRFQVWIDPAAASDFIGKQILEIRDQEILREHDAEFAEFAKHLKRVDGQIEMDFRAEILRLTR
jgi:SAM-dependent methyltransferase